MAIRHLLLLGVGLSAQCAIAICPAPEPKVCSEFFTSDKVFFGQVIEITPLREDGTKPGDDDVYEKIRFVIKVERALKGTLAAIESVETGNDTGRWIADVGDRRVVFAHQGQVGGLCSPIDEAEHAEETLRAIRRLKAAPGPTTIEGEVTAGGGGRAPGFSPAAGRVVKVTGLNRSYRAMTDRRGRFSIAVAPGHYRFESPDLSTTVYGRLDADDFDLAPGQCAQFQLWTPPR